MLRQIQQENTVHLPLVDEISLCVFAAPEDKLVEKLLSNLEEVKLMGICMSCNNRSTIEIKKGKFINMPGAETLMLRLFIPSRYKFLPTSALLARH